MKTMDVLSEQRNLRSLCILSLPGIYFDYSQDDVLRDNVWSPRDQHILNYAKLPKQIDLLYGVH
jgi:hypothetical protein